MLLDVVEWGGVAHHSAAGKLISETIEPHRRRCRQNNRALAPGMLD